MLQTIATLLEKKSIFLLAMMLALALRVVTAFTLKGHYFSDEFSSYLEVVFQWLHPDFTNFRPVDSITIYRSSAILYWHYFWLRLLTYFVPYDPSLALAFLKAIAAVLSMSVVYFLHRLNRLFLPVLWARWITSAFAFWYYSFFFGNRLMSENYALLFVAPALYFLCRAVASAGRANLMDLLLAGIFVALAAEMRLQAAFFCIGPALYFLARRQWRELGSFSLGFWLLCAGCGLAEVFSKGAAFATLRSFYEVQVTQSLIFINPSPWYAFLADLNTQFSEWLFPFLLFFAVWGGWRAPLLGLSVLGYAAAHLAFPHKEVRFMYPINPFLFALFGIGLYRATALLAEAKSFPRRITLLAVALFTTANLAQASRTSWTGGVNGDAFSLVEWAGKQPGISEMHVLDHGKASGYFTFNRDVPLHIGFNKKRHDLLTMPPPQASALILHPAEMTAEVQAWLARYGIAATVVARRGKLLVLQIAG